MVSALDSRASGPSGFEPWAGTRCSVLGQGTILTAMD